MPDRLKTSLGHLGPGRDGHPLRARRLPARARLASRRADKVRRAVDGLGDLMDDYEFHYPDELSRDNLDEVREALDGHGIYCLASGLHLDPRNGKGGLSSPDDGVRDDGAARSRSTPASSPARSARTSSSGRGSRATTTRSRRPTRESWARFIDGVGAGRDRAGRARPEALPRAQELRAGDEDLHAQHRDDAARHPQAARRGDRQHPGQHGLAAPAHERRAPAGVRRAAGRRGAARPPARQLGLGHLRRRQHGRRDGLHGDRRAGHRAAPRRLRRQRRAAGLRPVPVHRGPGRGRQALGGAVALHRRGRPAHRRRRPARGAAAQGRRRGLRARLRRAGRRPSRV